MTECPVEAVGCKVILKVQSIQDLDPVFKSAKKSGIVIADHEDSRRAEAGVDKGTVVAIGPSCSQEYIKGIEVGDIVAFPKYGGKIVTALEDLEDKYLVINDEDVVCKYRRTNG